MVREERPIALRYGVALGSVLVAALLRQLLSPIWVDRHLFLTFYGAVMVSAWYGGLGPGLMALALSAAASDFLWMGKPYALDKPSLSDGIGLIGFAVVGLLVVSLNEALHRARRRIEASATAFRANAAALKESEGHFRAISEMISDYASITAVESDGTLVVEWISEAFRRNMGYSLGDLNARPMQERIHPDDFEIARLHRERLLAGQPDTAEMRMRARNGEVRWIRDYSRPIWDSSKERVVRIYGSAQDITERKRMEEELKARV